MSPFRQQVNKSHEIKTSTSVVFNDFVFRIAKLLPFKPEKIKVLEIRYF